jgi:hypothetical protein
LRATDLILQGGGFGFIAVDLSDIAPRLVRHVPLESWFRFRRAVEDTPTVLVLLEQESNAKTCASLGLRMEAEGASWAGAVPGPDADSVRHSLGWLLDGLSARGEVSRSPGRMVKEGIFSTRTDWDYFSCVRGAKSKAKARSKDLTQRAQSKGRGHGEG